ncbi:ATP-binding protein [Phreatobacter stygius]|uniref:histidine kinase n=1 Tax=Phreatobacter stygius TaxID=1940610 RepID=A0A4D7B6J6_9HYPH|nr:ATP-binding protein [Phreatobacter stygius]QCI66705.1 hypothetical protein E8M01_22180 [Phreatobacter stygius]
MDVQHANDAWLVAATLCAFLVLAGQVTLESGLVRAKHSVNAAAKALVQAGLSVLIIWAIGEGLMATGDGHRLIGHGPFLPGAEAAGPILLFHIALAAGAATILSGPLAERTTLRGYALAVAVFTAVILPPVVHWAWAVSADGAGWLKAIGFIDLAGGAVIHVTGGAAALAAAWMIGPRSGRFDGVRRLPVIQSQSFPFAALGVLLLWLGWFGIAAGQTMAAGVPLAPVVLNLVLAGAAGIAAVFVLNQLRPAEVTVIHLVHAALAGVIAAGAGAQLFSPAGAVAIGTAGALAALVGARLVEALKIDDALGMASVHLFAGALGTLALATTSGEAPFMLLAVQALGVLAIAGFASGMMTLALAGGRMILKLRVDADQERIGLNVAEHGMTTDVALLVGQMSAVNRHSSSFAYLDADGDGEIGQVAREYNRAVDIFRAQITGVKTELSQAEAVIDETSAAFARLQADLAQRDEKLEEAAREVALLTDQLARSLVTVQGLKSLRIGLVKLVGRTFRAPIERLHAMAKRAEATREPADIDALIEAAREESARLARRLADVIDYAEVSTFETPPATDRMAVEKLIAEINMIYRPRADAKRLKLRVVWGPEISGMAASATALRRIMGELVGNAIDRTGSGGLVSLSAQRGGDGQLILDVVDSGAGISPGAIAAALDPLAERIYGADEEPAGLGLALVKKLVDLYGGTFTIRSKPGIGTQVRVMIRPAHLSEPIARPA